MFLFNLKIDPDAAGAATPLPAPIKRPKPKIDPDEAGAAEKSAQKSVSEETTGKTYTLTQLKKDLVALDQMMKGYDEKVSRLFKKAKYKEGISYSKEVLKKYERTLGLISKNFPERQNIISNIENNLSKLKAAHQKNLIIAQNAQPKTVAKKTEVKEAEDKKQTETIEQTQKAQLSIGQVATQFNDVKLVAHDSSLSSAQKAHLKSKYYAVYEYIRKGGEISFNGDYSETDKKVTLNPPVEKEEENKILSQLSFFIIEATREQHEVGKQLTDSNFSSYFSEGLQRLIFLNKYGNNFNLLLNAPENERIKAGFEFGKKTAEKLFAAGVSKYDGKSFLKDYVGGLKEAGHIDFDEKDNDFRSGVFAAFAYVSGYPINARYSMVKPTLKIDEALLENLEKISYKNTNSVSKPVPAKILNQLIDEKVTEGAGAIEKLCYSISAFNESGDLTVQDYQNLKKYFLNVDQNTKKLEPEIIQSLERYFYLLNTKKVIIQESIQNQTKLLIKEFDEKKISDQQLWSEKHYVIPFVNHNLIFPTFVALSQKPVEKGEIKNLTEVEGSELEFLNVLLFNEKQGDYVSGQIRLKTLAELSNQMTMAGYEFNSEDLILISNFLNQVSQNKYKSKGQPVSLNTGVLTSLDKTEFESQDPQAMKVYKQTLDALKKISRVLYSINNTAIEDEGDVSIFTKGLEKGINVLDMFMPDNVPLKPNFSTPSEKLYKFKFLLYGDAQKAAQHLKPSFSFKELRMFSKKLDINFSVGNLWAFWSTNTFDQGANVASPADKKQLKPYELFPGLLKKVYLEGVVSPFEDIYTVYQLAQNNHPKFKHLKNDNVLKTFIDQYLIFRGDILKLERELSAKNLQIHDSQFEQLLKEKLSKFKESISSDQITHITSSLSQLPLSRAYSLAGVEKFKTSNLDEYLNFIEDFDATNENLLLLTNQESPSVQNLKLLTNWYIYHNDLDGNDPLSLVNFGNSYAKRWAGSTWGNHREKIDVGLSVKYSLIDKKYNYLLHILNSNDPNKFRLVSSFYKLFYGKEFEVTAQNINQFKTVLKKQKIDEYDSRLLKQKTNEITKQDLYAHFYLTFTDLLKSSPRNWLRVMHPQEIKKLVNSDISLNIDRQKFNFAGLVLKELMEGDGKIDGMTIEGDQKTLQEVLLPALRNKNLSQDLKIKMIKDLFGGKEPKLMLVGSSSSKVHPWSFVNPENGQLRNPQEITNKLFMDFGLADKNMKFELDEALADQVIQLDQWQVQQGSWLGVFKSLDKNLMDSYGTDNLGTFINNLSSLTHSLNQIQYHSKVPKNIKQAAGEKVSPFSKRTDAALAKLGKGIKNLTWVEPVGNMISEMGSERMKKEFAEWKAQMGAEMDAGADVFIKKRLQNIAILMGYTTSEAVKWDDLLDLEITKSLVEILGEGPERSGIEVHKDPSTGEKIFNIANPFKFMQLLISTELYMRWAPLWYVNSMNKFSEGEYTEAMARGVGAHWMVKRYKVWENTWDQIAKHVLKLDKVPNNAYRQFTQKWAHNIAMKTQGFYANHQRVFEKLKWITSPIHSMTEYVNANSNIKSLKSLRQAALLAKEPYHLINVYADTGFAVAKAFNRRYINLYGGVARAAKEITRKKTGRMTELKPEEMLLAERVSKVKTPVVTLKELRSFDALINDELFFKQSGTKVNRVIDPILEKMSQLNFKSVDQLKQFLVKSGLGAPLVDRVLLGVKEVPKDISQYLAQRIEQVLKQDLTISTNKGLNELLSKAVNNLEIESTEVLVSHYERIAARKDYYGAGLKEYLLEKLKYIQATKLQPYDSLQSAFSEKLLSVFGPKAKSYDAFYPERFAHPENYLLKPADDIFEIAKQAKHSSGKNIYGNNIRYQNIEKNFAAVTNDLFDNFVRNDIALQEKAQNISTQILNKQLTVSLKEGVQSKNLFSVLGMSILQKENQDEVVKLLEKGNLAQIKAQYPKVYARLIGFQTEVINLYDDIIKEIAGDLSNTSIMKEGIDKVDDLLKEKIYQKIANHKYARFLFSKNEQLSYLLIKELIDYKGQVERAYAEFINTPVEGLVKTKKLDPIMKQIFEKWGLDPKTKGVTLRDHLMKTMADNEIARVDQLYESHTKLKQSLLDEAEQLIKKKYPDVNLKEARDFILGKKLPADQKALAKALADKEIAQVRSKIINANNQILAMEESTLNKIAQKAKQILPASNRMNAMPMFALAEAVDLKEMSQGIRKAMFSAQIKAEQFSQSAIGKSFTTMYQKGGKMFMVTFMVTEGLQIAITGLKPLGDYKEFKDSLKASALIAGGTVIGEKLAAHSKFNPGKSLIRSGFIVGAVIETALVAKEYWGYDSKVLAMEFLESSAKLAISTAAGSAAITAGLYAGAITSETGPGALVVFTVTSVGTYAVLSLKDWINTDEYVIEKSLRNIQVQSGLPELKIKGMGAYAGATGGDLSDFQKSIETFGNKNVIENKIKESKILKNLLSKINLKNVVVPNGYLLGFPADSSKGQVLLIESILMHLHAKKLYQVNDLVIQFNKTYRDSEGSLKAEYIVNADGRYFKITGTLDDPTYTKDSSYTATSIGEFADAGQFVYATDHVSVPIYANGLTDSNRYAEWLKGYVDQRYSHLSSEERKNIFKHYQNRPVLEMIAEQQKKPANYYASINKFLTDFPSGQGIWDVNKYGRDVREELNGLFQYKVTQGMSGRYGGSVPGGVSIMMPLVKAADDRKPLVLSGEVFKQIAYDKKEVNPLVYELFVSLSQAGVLDRDPELKKWGELPFHDFKKVMGDDNLLATDNFGNRDKMFKALKEGLAQIKQKASQYGFVFHEEFSEKVIENWAESLANFASSKGLNVTFEMAKKLKIQDLNLKTQKEFIDYLKNSLGEENIFKSDRHELVGSGFYQFLKSYSKYESALMASASSAEQTNYFYKKFTVIDDLSLRDRISKQLPVLMQKINSKSALSDADKMMVKEWMRHLLNKTGKNINAGIDFNEIVKAFKSHFAFELANINQLTQFSVDGRLDKKLISTLIKISSNELKLKTSAEKKFLLRNMSPTQQKLIIFSNPEFERKMTAYSLKEQEQIKATVEKWLNNPRKMNITDQQILYALLTDRAIQKYSKDDFVLKLNQFKRENIKTIYASLGDLAQNFSNGLLGKSGFDGAIQIFMLNELVFGAEASGIELSNADMHPLDELKISGNKYLKNLILSSAHRIQHEKYPHIVLTLESDSDDRKIIYHEGQVYAYSESFTPDPKNKLFRSGDKLVNFSQWAKDQSMAFANVLTAHHIKAINQSQVSIDASNDQLLIQIRNKTFRMEGGKLVSVNNLKDLTLIRLSQEYNKGITTLISQKANQAAWQLLAKEDQRKVNTYLGQRTHLVIAYKSVIPASIKEGNWNDYQVQRGLIKNLSSVNLMGLSLSSFMALVESGQAVPNIKGNGELELIRNFGLFENKEETVEQYYALKLREASINMLTKGLATLEGPNLEFVPKAGYGDEIIIAMPEIKEGYSYRWKDPHVKKALVRQASMFINWSLRNLKKTIGHTKEYQELESRILSGKPGLRKQEDINRLLSLTFENWHNFDLSKEHFEY